MQLIVIVSANNKLYNSTCRIGDLGSGSDHTGFYHRQGITSMDAAYYYDKVSYTIQQNETVSKEHCCQFTSDVELGIVPNHGVCMMTFNMCLTLVTPSLIKL